MILTRGCTDDIGREKRSGLWEVLDTMVLEMDRNNQAPYIQETSG